MAEKPRYGVYNPDLNSPLFIRVANNTAGVREIVKGLAEGTRDEASRELALSLDQESVDLTDFVHDLRELLKDIGKNGLENRMIDYLNAYMGPSILMHSVDESTMSSHKRGYWLSIKDREAPWLEAVVCYNLSVYLKMFGPSGIKECQGCGKFFVQGKMKYKYCSEGCKRRSGDA